MRKYANKVEIKDPPITEFKKTKNCCTKTCLSGLGCIIFFVVASLLLLKFIQSPKNKEVKDLPQFLTDSVPLYAQKNINKIDYIAGKNKNRLVEILAYIPKIIAYPFIIEYENIKQSKIKKENEDETTEAINKPHFDFAKYKQKVFEPVTDQRDYYEIEWVELDAQSDFVLKYYKTELQNQNFNISFAVETPALSQFSFTKDNIEGILYIKDDIIKHGTDYVLMKVKIPNPEI